MSYLDEIEKPQALRKEACKCIMELIPPHPADTKANTDFNKKMKELREAHHDSCFGVERHVDVLIKALLIACGTRIKAETCVDTAAATIPIEPWIGARLAELEQAKREKREVTGQRDIRDEIAEKTAKK